MSLSAQALLATPWKLRGDSENKQQLLWFQVIKYQCKESLLGSIIWNCQGMRIVCLFDKRCQLPFWVLNRKEHFWLWDCLCIHHGVCWKNRRVQWTRSPCPSTSLKFPYQRKKKKSAKSELQKVRTLGASFSSEHLASWRLAFPDYYSVQNAFKDCSRIGNYYYFFLFLRLRTN